MQNSRNYDIINKFLDKHFDFWKTQGDYAFSYFTEKIPDSMLDKSKNADDEEYSFWVPIKSSTTQDEISSLEKLLKHQLPGSYKYFLLQKHFIELHLGGGPRFFSHIPNKLVSTFSKILKTYYSDLIKKNYLPFADFGDWGVLCFNANNVTPDNDYEIVILDHEDGYNKPTAYAKSFIDMFNLLETELDETIRQITEHKKN